MTQDLADVWADEARVVFGHVPVDEIADDEALHFRTTPDGHLVIGRRLADVQDEYTLVGFDQPEGLAVMHTRRWLHPEGGAPNVVARMFRDGEVSHEAVVPFVRVEDTEADT